MQGGRKIRTYLKCSCSRRRDVALWAAQGPHGVPEIDVEAVLMLVSRPAANCAGRTNLLSNNKSYVRNVSE